MLNSVVSIESAFKSIFSKMKKIKKIESFLKQKQHEPIIVHYTIPDSTDFKERVKIIKKEINQFYSEPKISGTLHEVYKQNKVTSYHYQYELETLKICLKRYSIVLRNSPFIQKYILFSKVLKKNMENILLGEELKLNLIELLEGIEFKILKSNCQAIFKSSIIIFEKIEKILFLLFKTLNFLIYLRNLLFEIAKLLFLNLTNAFSQDVDTFSLFIGFTARFYNIVKEHFELTKDIYIQCSELVYYYFPKREQVYLYLKKEISVIQMEDIMITTNEKNSLNIELPSFLDDSNLDLSKSLIFYKNNKK
ncbi:hypothetical protein ABK040_005353 [Willaertia magna]